MTGTYPPHLECDSPAGLSAIRQTGVNMAVWKRAVDAGCEPAIKALLAARYAVALDLDPATAEAVALEIRLLVRRQCDSHSSRGRTAASAAPCDDLLKEVLRLASENLESQRGIIPLEKILNTGRFDMEKEQASAGWLRELNNVPPRPRNTGSGALSFERGVHSIPGASGTSSTPSAPGSCVQRDVSGSQAGTI